MKRSVLWLVIALPATAVLMGAVSLFLAMQGPDQAIRVGEVPLSKTSWQVSSELEVEDDD